MLPSNLTFIKEQLDSLESKMLAEVDKRSFLLKTLHPEQFHSARNLIHYLTLRKEEIRPLQNELHTLGLSSLASAESHIRRQIQAIQERIGMEYSPEQLEVCTYDFSKTILANKNIQLFGPKPGLDEPYIMVTFDVSFAENLDLIKNLLKKGMNVCRINCAHDDEKTWSKMILNLKKACQKTGLNCKIYMDLAGPKIRTQILNKGKDKGKVKIKLGQLIWLAYESGGFEKEDVVISPNEPGIIPFLKIGERVFIDDGIILGFVEKIKKGVAGIRITRISSSKSHIKKGKGINFPDTHLSIPSLTDYDKKCLPFICSQADLIGYSFVRTPEDITELHKLLQIQSQQPPKLILKIETHEAVKNLPHLLLAGMQQAAFGVMIARGDLAVEIGFERTGEIQEEILWICEAAHTPVVWATQVLESLNKSGMATRSEITDAGQAAQAECVMINKGEYTLEVLEAFRNIFHRSMAHKTKKRFIFRPLGIAAKFIDS
ncbi:pyruvate kinase [Rhodonellum sp.]|uniref:pyruvate kinase n=1 Tax=Rhodonellum sp. TaxID=2231180 RepID=UPI002726C848|nr:pyruvate kinase [Rhodonellum sp.]MDO9552556.1 pyruvate kinase [Rhodonellum sp.]